MVVKENLAHIAMHTRRVGFSVLATEESCDEGLDEVDHDKDMDVVAGNEHVVVMWSRRDASITRRVIGGHSDISTEVLFNKERNREHHQDPPPLAVTDGLGDNVHCQRLSS
ncbi:hypothetical protein PTKIN_Ptkin16aG0530500 [Pterospermum kingtungense]